MPTVVKSSSKLALLGELSTFSVTSSAVPADTADSSGSVPTFSAMFVDGTEQEYLVGESLTLTSPSIGSYSGEIVSYSKSKATNRYNLDTNSIMARLNADIRVYPLADYAEVVSTYMPLYSLEYWTQQCGIFYTAVQGDVLFYQSNYGHFGAFAKDITRPIRSTRTLVEPTGVNGGMYSSGGRVWTGFGTGFESKVDFPLPTEAHPESGYLPVRIPKATETTRMTFGLDVNLNGTGHSAKATWYFADSNGNKPSIRLLAESDIGFTLQVAEAPDVYTTQLTQAVPNDARYSVYISASSSSATQTRFTMTVLDANGSVVSTQTAYPTTSIKGSLSLRIVKYYSELGGSGSEMTYGNSFISLLTAHPTTRFADAKVLTLGYKGSAFMVGFNGNVWEHIKQYCSIYHLDVSYQNGKLTIGPRQKDVKVGASLSELTTTIQAREQARNVEVVNQNHKSTGNSADVLWAADSVYQVAVGEVQEFLVQTPHSILQTSQPVCVSGISPFPYKTGAGQYVVTGSDGYIVSPSFWADQGGSITTDTTDNEGEIKIIIKGPDYDSARAPYRISEGDAGRPALYVTGLGILAKPETLKVATGNGRAAKDIGTTLDSPFISSAQLAYDAATRAGRVFATPDVSMTIAEPLLYDEVSKLGTYPAGALVKSDGNIMRVVTADQGYSALTGSAVQHNTIYQLNRSYGTGATIAAVKAYNAGKTIGQVNIKPMKVVN